MSSELTIAQVRQAHGILFGSPKPKPKYTPLQLIALRNITIQPYPRPVPGTWVKWRDIDSEFEVEIERAHNTHVVSTFKAAS